MNRWLEDIYKEHRRGLFGLALSIVREAAAAEDAVHEAFARMVKRRDRPTGDAVAYVYRAVRNTSIDQVRRRNARPATTDDLASLFKATAQNDPSQIAQRSETQTMLMQAIDNLPEDEREVVVMRSFGGLTLKQVAHATGRPLTTIASKYRRALGRLKQQMEGTHVNA